MPDDFDAYITDEPYRTKRGALKYQPADTDWNLGRLNELKDFYQTTYKRPLPIIVAGQGSIHNKWGYDHRASADISLNPASEEGQALISELQRRRVPFLAFDKAIPGVATGPHIHVGQPSHRTTAKYGVGQQLKSAPKTLAAKPAPTPDDFDAYVVANTPIKPPAAPARQPRPSTAQPRRGGIFGHPNVAAAVQATQPDTGMGAFRRALRRRGAWRGGRWRLRFPSRPRWWIQPDPYRVSLPLWSALPGCARRCWVIP